MKKCSFTVSKEELLLLLVLFLTSGCASITGSRNQPVTVTTTSSGQSLTNALCVVTNDKGSWYVTTPGSVTIRKAYGDLGISCKKDKYAGGASFKSENEAATWGNVLVGGLIGYAVDAGSGAGFSYPPTMNVEMEKLAE